MGSVQLVCQKPWLPSPALSVLAVLELARTPSTLEVEAARSEVRGQPELHVTVTYDENLHLLENVLPRSVALVAGSYAM